MVNVYYFNSASRFILIILFCHLVSSYSSVTLISEEIKDLIFFSIVPLFALLILYVMGALGNLRSIYKYIHLLNLKKGSLFSPDMARLSQLCRRQDTITYLGNSQLLMPLILFSLHNNMCKVIIIVSILKKNKHSSKFSPIAT